MLFEYMYEYIYIYIYIYMYIYIYIYIYNLLAYERRSIALSINSHTLKG